MVSHHTRLTVCKHYILKWSEMHIESFPQWVKVVVVKLRKSIISPWRLCLIDICEAWDLSLERVGTHSVWGGGGAVQGFLRLVHNTLCVHSITAVYPQPGRVQLIHARSIINRFPGRFMIQDHDHDHDMKIYLRHSEHTVTSGYCQLFFFIFSVCSQR